MVGLTSILREAWNTATNAEDKREKIQALSLAKECYSMKLDLLTNATVVEDAIRFVAEKTRERTEKLKSCFASDNSEDEESKRPNYDQDIGSKEEDENKTGEITEKGQIATTTNNVF